MCITCSQFNNHFITSFVCTIQSKSSSFQTVQNCECTNFLYKLFDLFDTRTYDISSIPWWWQYLNFIFIGMYLCNLHKFRIPPFRKWFVNRCRQFVNIFALWRLNKGNKCLKLDKIRTTTNGMGRNLNFIGLILLRID